MPLIMPLILCKDPFELQQTNILLCISVKVSNSLTVFSPWIFAILKSIPGLIFKYIDEFFSPEVKELNSITTLLSKISNNFFLSIYKCCGDNKLNLLPSIL